MNYEEAKIIKSELETNVNIHSEIIEKFKTNDIGLVSNDIRISKEYQEANYNYEVAFKKLQEFNKYFIKTFKKRICSGKK